MSLFWKFINNIIAISSIIVYEIDQEVVLHYQLVII